MHSSVRSRVAFVRTDSPLSFSFLPGRFGGPFFFLFVSLVKNRHVVVETFLLAFPLRRSEDREHTGETLARPSGTDDARNMTSTQPRLVSLSLFLSLSKGRQRNCVSTNYICVGLSLCVRGGRIFLHFSCQCSFFRKNRRGKEEILCKLSQCREVRGLKKHPL